MNFSLSFIYNEFMSNERTISTKSLIKKIQVLLLFLDTKERYIFGLRALSYS